MTQKNEQTSDHHWRSVRLRSLVNHIVETHHRYLRVVLPKLELAAGRLAQGTGDQTTAGELYALVRQIRRDLELQIGKEESILFPALLELETTLTAGRPQEYSPFGSIANLSRAAGHDQEKSLRIVEEARALADAWAQRCNDNRELKAVLGNLTDLADDLRLHTHLEGGILFPRAIDLERGTTGSESTDPR